MNLATTYLGLPLAHPFVPGASPLVDNLDTVKRLQDAGAPAFIMHSLFEEQIEREHARTAYDLEAHANVYAEATSFFPRPDEFRLGPEAYLEQIRRIKDATGLPVIASLNGMSLTGWPKYARLIQEAGADALELNVYHVATDPGEASVTIERRVLDLVEAVAATIRLPLAVKLSPFHAALPHFAAQLHTAGARALVLFNRFYQPDIDLEALDVTPRLHLSDSSELLLRVHWLAILSGRTQLELSASGGVHTAADALKALMAGATTVQMVSALLRKGPSHLGMLIADVIRWLQDHDYESLDQLRGSMNLARCPDPAAFERGNYVRLLQTWKAGEP